MATHEQKQCARCDNSIECKTGSIELCQCSRVELTDNHREYIHSLYPDCLCAACLLTLSHQYDLTEHKKLIVQPMNNDT